MRTRSVVKWVVVVVILLLAFECYRLSAHNAWQAGPAAIRSDMRNLAAAAETYRARTGSYPASWQALGDSVRPQPSPDVTVAIVEATERTLRLRGTNARFRDSAACTMTVTAGGAGDLSPIECDGFANWLNRGAYR